MIYSADISYFKCVYFTDRCERSLSDCRSQNGLFSNADGAVYVCRDFGADESSKRTTEPKYHQCQPFLYLSFSCIGGKSVISESESLPKQSVRKEKKSWLMVSRIKGMLKSILQVFLLVTILEKLRVTRGATRLVLFCG